MKIWYSGINLVPSKLLGLPEKLQKRVIQKNRQIEKKSFFHVFSQISSSSIEFIVSTQLLRTYHSGFKRMAVLELTNFGGKLDENQPKKWGKV